MTVKELRQMLDEYDDNLLVTVDGYEDGNTANFAVAEIKVIKQELDEGNWWSGEYSMPYGDEPDAITVLNIGGRT